MNTEPKVSDIGAALAELADNIRDDLARGIAYDTAVATLNGTVPLLFEPDELALMLAVAVVELARREATS